MKYSASGEHVQAVYSDLPLQIYLLLENVGKQILIEVFKIFTIV